ncbi:DNA/RNA non-specific endonuclease [Leptolyngbya sp. FACHB-671]|uniref:DNA/RNA non-specific endonuclease n=1 Tax=Leptolyngbya sp. FACHB-671 TaxID=2692812 RepID=UPI001687B6FF|nr:DNA/RNA non-specific endonuclease [Leptolyngbya sp. FACHB-671]
MEPHSGHCIEISPNSYLHSATPTWRGLEDYSRDLVEEGNELYIVAGSYGEQKRIGSGQVVVPTNTWKVVVVLEPGSSIEDITEETRVIAVDMPNQDGIDPDWETYSRPPA